MKVWIVNLWNRLQGHRAALAAGILTVAAFGLVFAGKIGTGPAMVVLVVAAGIAGLSGKLNRNEAALLALLGIVGKAGVDYRKGDRDAAVRDLEPIAGVVASKVLPALSVHLTNADPESSLHVFGSDPEAVLKAAAHLAGRPEVAAQ